MHRKNGNTAFYSYRDPAPEAALAIYGGSEKFTESFTAENEDLTDIIIGTLGAADPLLSPHMQGEMATADYLRGRTKEERIAFRKALLSIGKDDLLAEAAQISALLANASVCVIGAKEKLEAAKNAGEIDFIRDFGAAEG